MKVDERDKYKVKTLEILADNYDDFSPDAGLIGGMEFIIISKCDFDSAYSVLNKAEQHLVFQPYCTESWKIGQRQKIFSKMARFLNGES